MRIFKIVVLLSLSCLAKERCVSSTANSELLYLSTQTHTLVGHKFISVPLIKSQHTASKLLKHFLSLLSLVYVNKLNSLRALEESLYQTTTKLFVRCTAKHVLFPCPSVHPNLQSSHNLTAVSTYTKYVGVLSRFIYL
jgi:hypothetical protein